MVRLAQENERSLARWQILDLVAQELVGMPYETLNEEDRDWIECEAMERGWL